VHILAQQYLTRFIDFFYPPFARFIPIATFRYGVTGGSNACFNFLVFYLSYTYIYKGSFLHIAGFTVTPYIAANLTALLFSFPVGFILNKYLVFKEASGRGRHQIMLYGTLTLLTISMNYALLHFMVGYLGFWATPSQAFIMVLMSLFSYFFQKHVTFR